MLILFVTAAILLCLASFTDVVLNAREGREDDAGFHPQPVPVERQAARRHNHDE